MNKTFICQSKDNTNYYIEDSGMGSFLNPPGDAETLYSVQGYRRGHNTESLSLRGAIESEWIPTRVKLRAKNLLKKHTGTLTESWVKEVYKYFNHCYSIDGVNRNVNNCLTFGKFWNNADQEKNQPVTNHLGYMYVKSFFADHEVRKDLINYIEEV